MDTPLWSDNFWTANGVDLDVVKRRCDDGNKCLKQFQQYLADRAAIEEAYVTSLRDLVKKSSAVSKQDVTVGGGWTGLKEHTEKSAQTHDIVFSNLRNSAVKPLDVFRNAQIKFQKQLFGEANKLIKERASMEARCKTLKDHYVKC